MAVESGSKGNIEFYPVAQFRRKPDGGLSMVYSGHGKLTFSHALGHSLEGQRIAFGELGGKLCFVFVLGIERPGIKVTHRQASDSVLKRNCKGLGPGTRVYFEFDTESAIFIESRRERIDSKRDTSGTIGATRQPAELQP